MTQTFVEQRHNIGGLGTLEVDQDGGDDLWMLVANKVGRGLRLHKVERFHAAGGFARFENVLQQAGGALFAQRPGQHRTQVFVGVQAQRRELLGIRFELTQHFSQLLMRHLTHVGHRAAQVLDLTLVQVFENFRSALFANGHHQDGAFFGSGQTHSSLLIHSRITSATTRGSFSDMSRMR